MFIILEGYKKTCRDAKCQTDAYIERIPRRMSDSFFAAVSAAMFVVCRTDKPRDIIRAEPPQRNKNLKQVSVYQSELSTFRGGMFKLQSKIGLSINGTGNLIFDRKIRF